MNKEKVQAASSGLSIPGLLGVVFVTLKLVGLINWSWWWVLCPFWAAPALAVSVFLLCVLGAGVAFCFSELKGKKK